MTAFAPTLQAFFTQYLTSQRGASPHTITAYRDTLRLLLGYTQRRTGTAPSLLDISHLTADLVADFLTHLEHDRGNSVRTRNARLAAIHSLFAYAAPRHPEHADLIAQVLAIPAKKAHRTVITYLTEPEVTALLAAPDRGTWTGRRDHLSLLIMITTGVRVAELTALTREDTAPPPGAHLAVHGKGRKDRATPVDDVTAAAVACWLAENPGQKHDPLLTARGTRRKLSSDAVAQRITVHAATAAAGCPTLAGRTITPHVLRHTTAMRMLAAGNDITTIALWLGCAARRSVVSPAQRAEMRGDISGSDG
jgi:site-specific recombinase XerD